MRRLSRRPKLESGTLYALNRAKRMSQHSSNSTADARKRWKQARQRIWFKDVLLALRKLAGPGQACMFCSSNESSDIDHLKPKSVFPGQTFDWENLLWVCAVCNRYKGDRYPPITEPGPEILDPAGVNPWDHLFIDRVTGLLVGVWRIEINAPDERAESTIRIVNLNREALQERRLARVKQLVKFARESLRRMKARPADRSKIRGEIRRFLRDPIHPDVTQYFLDGPGGRIEPFRSLLRETVEPS